MELKNRFRIKTDTTLRNPTNNIRSGFSTPKRNLRNSVSSFNFTGRQSVSNISKLPNNRNLKIS